MKILVTGAAGMIGRNLVERLARDKALNGKAITRLVLHDVVAPAVPPGPDATAVAGDLAAEGAAAALVAGRPDVIFHLAGVVSGEAEADFGLGYRVNLDGTRDLFEAIRAAGIAPRVVYASSCAVYGAPFPPVVPDEFHLTPLTSYGTQKMMGEALLADYSRRGMLDGVGLRFPTISVRPGKPNRAASGFLSGIIREPLAGLPAVLPVPREVVQTLASPRAAVGFLLHAAGLDTGSLGAQRSVTLPGVAVSVGGMIETLRAVAGDRAAALIEDRPDPVVRRIVESWPQRFEARRARDLGFTAEASFEAIVRAHIEDEHGGRLPA
jgi:nucleoside-diphosphate-sugar epimerase